MNKKIIVGSIATLLIIFSYSSWQIYSEIFTKSSNKEKVEFTVEKGESVVNLAKKLEKRGVIGNSWLFEKYLAYEGLDKKMHAGTFEVEAPVTLAKVAQSLDQPTVQEQEITILPGWNLRDVAKYFAKNDIASKEELYQIVGKPTEQTNQNYTRIFDQEPKVLRQKPLGISLEGYFRPDTFRVYADATAEEIIKKLVAERNGEITKKMYQDIEKQGKNIHEIITLASLLEREVQSREDKKIVADIFWRRLEENWALQADSTVHYISGRSGDVFTTSKERDSKNKYNTYEYPGLPPGPISNPSLESIKAAIYPQKNNHWYFLTDKSGKVHYAGSLSEHNQNVQKYLR